MRQFLLRSVFLSIVLCCLIAIPVMLFAAPVVYTYNGPNFNTFGDSIYFGEVYDTSNKVTVSIITIDGILNDGSISLDDSNIASWSVTDGLHTIESTYGYGDDTSTLNISGGIPSEWDIAVHSGLYVTGNPDLSLGYDSIMTKYGAGVGSDMGSTEWWHNILTGKTDDAYGQIDYVGSLGGWVVRVVIGNPALQEIIDTIRDAFSNPTLTPVGPGNSAHNRLRAFINMLEATGEFIEVGELEEACKQLESIRAKVDGDPSPPDWFEGESTSDILSKIDGLMTAIRCVE